MPETQPLVSILIGAFKPQFFVECMESALAQTYQNFELIVGDDGPGPEIEQITRDYAARDPRVSYYRNETNLGGRLNFIKLFQKSSGEMVKFLCDDDRLDPRCLERMVACLSAYPDVTLVTSHRRLIDSQGRETAATGRVPRVAAEDCRVSGAAVINRMVRTAINFIGEPTTAMFRRRDLADVQPDIFSFGGEQLVTSVDVVMWINLLTRGDAIFLTEPLSDFRRHPNQEQHNAFTKREAPKVWATLAVLAEKAGLLRPDRTIDMPVRPLGTMRPWWSPEVQAAVRHAERVLEQGNIAEALDALGQAKEMAPQESWIRVLLGGVRLITIDALGALREYREALALAPDHPRVLTNLAAALLATGEPSEMETARQLAMSAARLCPEDPDAQGLLAQLRDAGPANPPAAAPPG